MKPEHESKSERFIRLAEARVNKILTMFRLLGNLSHTGIYAYDKEQVEKIFTKLQMELINAKMRFLQPEKRRKKRFSLGVPYHAEAPEEDGYHPAFAFALPDGTYLWAVAYPNIDYPCIDIYWDNGVNEPSYPVCFAEFNPEKPDGQQVCVGVYCDADEDTKYYAPYNTAEMNQNE